MTKNTETAHGLGQKAFKNGLHAPAQDKKLLDMLVGSPIGGWGMELMDAWTKGWEEARANTPEHKKMMRDVFGVD